MKIKTRINLLVGGIVLAAFANAYAQATFSKITEGAIVKDAAQNPLEAHFGLGDATKIDTLRIEWPSGVIQESHNVRAKQFLTITEPARLSAVGKSDGSFSFSLTGGIGFTYGLESSSDLAHWTPWTTLTTTNRAMSITDTNATSASQRYYRAVCGNGCPPQLFPATTAMKEQTTKKQIMKSAIQTVGEGIWRI